MFHCNQCHTEYGGIRGITADRCPRCVAGDGSASTEEHAAQSVPLTVGSTDPWRAPQLATVSWAPPATPLTGAIAQLDRAVRI